MQALITYLSIDELEVRESEATFIFSTKVLYVKFTSLQWRVLGQWPVGETFVLWKCMRRKVSVRLSE